jgi:hypothetical protein
VGGIVLAVAACAAALFAASSACLPDLGALPSASDEAGSPPPPPTGPVCGDGIIEAFDAGTETCDPGDAATPGCAACRVTCEGTLDPSTQHCYFAAAPQADFAAARDACLARDAHILTIDSVAERDVVGSLAGPSAYWVGLSFEAALGAYGTRGAGVAQGLEPGWPEPAKGTGPCPGCFGFGRDGGGFAPLEDASVTASCVVASGAAWFGVECTHVTPPPQTICEREPRGQRSQSCGGAFCFTLPVTTKSYVLIPSPATADQAAKGCEDLSGRLVVLGSAEEREALVRELLTVFPFDPRDPLEVKRHWIGLSASDGGAFTWADGQTESARPVPWADGEPRAAGGAAYLRVGEDKYDTGLVSVETGPAEAHPYVCER